MLADYAVRVDASGRRRFPEPAHPYRNPFQRDRDRIIHARAFRRLENKTQVFTARISDHFRNRLTHTIEVAQISRTIAECLGLNVDLTEALSLVHDIGHPPFGHAGEKALNEAMRGNGLSFDHNLHALRIVESFELRYAAFRGLNLTFEVREGIIKHSRDYDRETHPDLTEYLLEQRPPLEAQLIDLTDEIAYTTADLDDGYEADILTVSEICGGVPAFAKAYAEAEGRYPPAREKLKFNEALKIFFNALVTDLIENTRLRLAAANVKTLAEVRRHTERLASFSPEMDRQRREAKDFLYANLYYSRDLKQDKQRAEEIVGELFEFWMKHPEELPRSYREQAGGEPLARVVCDYIAGMTDNFITAQYEQRCGSGRRRG
jgi:dGTPase